MREISETAAYYLLLTTYCLLLTTHYLLLPYLALAGGYERDESEAPAAHRLQTRPEVLRGQGKGMVRVRDGVRSADPGLPCALTRATSIFSNPFTCSVRGRGRGRGRETSIFSNPFTCRGRVR